MSGFATLVWPPTGIALAALVLFGRNLWPGIFIGAAAVNFIMGAPLLVAIGIGVGNTAEAVAGAYLLRRFKLQSQLARVPDVVLLIIWAASLATLISATVGTTSLLLGSTITPDAYRQTWLAWWIGDMLGNLIIAPLILVWATNHHFQLRRQRTAEGVLLATLFLGAGAAIFGASPTHTLILRSAPYLFFVLLVWAVLRFSARSVITLNFGLATMTVLAAIHARGPFIGQTLNERLYSSQLFIGTAAITFMLFSAVMSERREAQAVLQTLNQRLGQTLARRTTQLHKEKELEKLKDEFVAVTSHELKTPITSIKAFAHLINEKFASSNDKKSAYLAASIEKQADRLTRLIEELLDVSRIDSGELALHKSRFNLSEMLKKLVADFQYTTPTHQFITQLGTKCYIVADQGRLEQALLNLLTNAVKYSPQADEVVVRLNTEHAYVIVSVQDFGPGIPKKDQPKIFNRFYRTSDYHKNKQAVSGIGLGLYITSEIIKKHGGKLWVESTSDKGTTFSFSLPVQ